MLSKIKNAINGLFRPRINQQLQQKLKNRDFSVISSNCNGALMLHDLAQPFNSPFVNLYLEPADFVKYLQHLAHYNQQELHFIQNERPYPVGLLGDIKIYFMHYHSEQEAKAKWEQRLARLKTDNLFVIMTDRDGCTYQDLQAFDQLPYANKVVFTHKAYPELASAYYIRGFEQRGNVGDLFAYSGWCGKKYYDQFDFVNWFNQQ